MRVLKMAIGSTVVERITLKPEIGGIFRYDAGELRCLDAKEPDLTALLY